MPEHFYEPSHGGRPPKYPVRHLAVGESAYFTDTTHRKVANSLRQLRPMAFAFKTVMKGGLVQIKVTRTA